VIMAGNGERVKTPDKQESKEVARSTRFLDTILPVRLPSAKVELIKEEARELGITPSTLARIWILDSLRSLNGASGNGLKHHKTRSARNRWKEDDYDSQEKPG
jgi:hypothetical protein